MPTRPEFEIQADGLPHLVRVSYFGHVTAAGAEACANEIETMMTGMAAGFTVVTDLTGLASMDLECVPHLTRIMDVSRKHGVGTVVRVIPDRDKDIGFKILSIIHYGSGVQIITCETLAEAEQAIKPAVK